MMNNTGKVAIELAAEILRDSGAVDAAFTQCCETPYVQLDEATSLDSKVAAYAGFSDRLRILLRAVQLAAEHDENVRELETIIDPTFRYVFQNLRLNAIDLVPTEDQLLCVDEGLSTLKRELSQFAERATLRMLIQGKRSSDVPVDRLPHIVEQKKEPTLFGLKTIADSKLERVVGGDHLECIIVNDDQWALTDVRHQRLSSNCVPAHSLLTVKHNDIGGINSTRLESTEPSQPLKSTFKSKVFPRECSDEAVPQFHARLLSDHVSASRNEPSCESVHRQSSSLNAS